MPNCVCLFMCFKKLSLNKFVCCILYINVINNYSCNNYNSNNVVKRCFLINIFIVKFINCK